MNGGSIAVMGVKLPSAHVIAAGFAESARTSPALFAYAVLALCWTLLFARGLRLSGFASAIEDLSELQRAEILKRAYPGFVGKGLSSAAFIRARQRSTWLFALLALLLAAGVVTLVALQSIDWQAARYS
jgi:hypothetical protein